MSQPPHRLLKKWLLPFILVVGLVSFFASGLHHFLSFETLATHYGEIKTFITDNQIKAYSLFFAVYLLAVAFSLPVASLLTLAGGAIFGLPAAALILVAATAGAGIVFVAARSVLHDLLSAKAGPFLKKLESGFAENDFSYLLALRLVPVAPFWVVNIVPALLGMRLLPFITATFIGIMPGTVIYVLVARSFDIVLSQGKTPDLSTLSDIQVIGPLAALGLLALVPIFLKSITQKRQKKEGK
ncbi:MAG: TVP38/TMEM64 family protein [Candidatus Puniceispirillaceae bacterium]